MTKLDIYCGLLGTGKTTLIKKMLSTAYVGHKIAIIENEFGKVNLDAAELGAASIAVREITSGCVCCTLKGDFTDAIRLLVEQEAPEYIVVEASGVADLRGLVNACLESECVALNRVLTLVNGTKITKLLKVVGNFFKDQIRVSDTIYMNFCEKLSAEDIEVAKEELLHINPDLKIIACPLEQVGKDTFSERTVTNEAIPKRLLGTMGIENQDTTGKPAAKKATVQGALAQSRRKKIAQNTNLENWDYEFTCEFSEEMMDRLFTILKDESRHVIWRAKGYLKMQDGSTRKVDYVFGDTFEETKDLVSEEHTNLLVVIGPKLDEEWLEKQFEKFV